MYTARRGDGNHFFIPLVAGLSPSQGAVSCREIDEVTCRLIASPRQPSGQGQEDLGGGDGVAQRVVRTVYRQVQFGGQPLKLGLDAEVRSAEVGGARHRCGVNHFASQLFSVHLERPAEE